MPSGKTHDRITLWSLPVVAGLTFGLTLSASLTLLVAGGFLFGGLMFGPDLDIYSIQYKRWGWLRWIWIPYQKNLRHRSFLSHGPIVGTTLRILYLALWTGVLGMLALTASDILWGVQWDVELLVQRVGRSLDRYQIEYIAVYIGLEIGAMSHSLSDWTGSAYKRFKTRGFSALHPPSAKPKKRLPQRDNSKNIGKSPPTKR